MNFARAVRTARLAQHAAPVAAATESFVNNIANGRTPVTFFLIAGIIAGQLQGILGHASIPGSDYLDDAMFFLALFVALPRFGRLAAVPSALLILWVFVLGLQVVQSTQVLGFNANEMIFMFRQVAIPALAMLIGLSLLPDEWIRVARATVVIALLSVPYFLYELVIGRPVDPVRAVEEAGGYIGIYSTVNFLTGEKMERLGGPILSPPVAGLYLATAFFFAVYVFRFRFRWPVIVALGALTFLTGSRGAILLAGLSVLLAWASPRFHWSLSAAAIGVAIVPFALEISQQEKSARHSNGLMTGAEDALRHPFGRGFGFVGNHRPDAVTDGAGESLAGIAFSAGGIIILFLTVALFFVFLSRTRTFTLESRAAALGVGAILVALLAETASALNGTIPLWITVGYALTRYESLAAERSPLWVRRRSHGLTPLGSAMAPR